MSAVALSLLRPLDQGAPPIDHAPASITELAGLGRAEVAAPTAARPAELLRLGAELPEGVALATHTARSPDRATLEDVARIGAHLGGLERALAALPPEEGAYVAERLARARVLVDCASALVELRAHVAEGLRIARPA